jgi:hypothetical protein
MQENWPTEQEDLAIANDIIEKHIDMLDEHAELPMPRIMARLDNAVEYLTPDWMIEIAEAFDERYGLTQGDYITRRVLTHYLLRGKVVH